MFALVAALRFVAGDYCVVPGTESVVPWSWWSLLSDPSALPSDYELQDAPQDRENHDPSALPRDDELQEASKERGSHNPSAVPIDYDLQVAPQERGSLDPSALPSEL